MNTVEVSQSVWVQLDANWTLTSSLKKESLQQVPQLNLKVREVSEKRLNNNKTWGMLCCGMCLFVWRIISCGGGAAGVWGPETIWMERGTFCRGGYPNLAVVARVMNDGECWSFINFTCGGKKKFSLGLNLVCLNIHRRDMTLVWMWG